MGIFVWEVWVSNLGILEVRREVWIGNLGILEAKRDILDKRRHRIAQELDRLDEKANGRGGRKVPDKRGGGGA